MPVVNTLACFCLQHQVAALSFARAQQRSNNIFCLRLQVTTLMLARKFKLTGTGWTASSSSSSRNNTRSSSSLMDDVCTRHQQSCSCARVMVCQSPVVGSSVLNVSTQCSSPAKAACVEDHYFQHASRARSHHKMRNSPLRCLGTQ